MHTQSVGRRLGVFLVAGAIACSGDASPPNTSINPEGVARVDVSPTVVSLVVGASSQVTATVIGTRGSVLNGRAPAWSSSDNTVASVSGSGQVTALAAGSASVSASVDGVSGSAQVTVTRPQVASIAVTPPNITMNVGATMQLAAAAIGAAGDTLPGRTFTYSSSNSAAATVSANGAVTGVAIGTATITVTAEGQSATVPVTVQAGSPNAAVARVVLVPAMVNLVAGTAVQLAAAALDASDVVLSGKTFTFTTSNAAVAAISSAGLVTGVSAGTATISAASGGKQATSSVVVTSFGTANMIDVQPGVTFQTMAGWQGGGQNGWFECNPTAFNLYKDQVHDRLINELGIERVTIPLRSGWENTRDYWADFQAGRIDQATHRASWYTPVNDNGNALTTDSTKFFWSFLDGYIDNAILPLRQRMSARGEQLFLVLTYVDFVQDNVTKGFQQMKSPDEYAEFVTMAFKHIQQKYGFVPDAIELLLEPEHTTYTATDIGRALVATSARLRAHGFTPQIFGPSTTSMSNASTWYDVMTSVPGARGLLSELVYHRYVAVSQPALFAIGLRSQRDGVKSGMLEHIGSGFDDLYEDLTVGNVSSWMQYSNAYCGNRDNPDNDGVYYQVNQTDPGNPKVNITNHSKLFRQLFNYVRRGAVRIGATSGNTTDLLPLAFRNVNGKLVVVVRAKRAASFAIRGLPAGTYGINFGTPGTEWNMSLTDQTIGGGAAIQTSIPRDGVITIYAR